MPDSFNHSNLIVRQHNEGSTHSLALYSPCEIYRYALSREWNKNGKRLLYIMLNPSTATELKNDPTIERCERRARALDFGSFCACNLFAFRATDPRDLKKAKEPIGPENLAILMAEAEKSDVILCAWGTHGSHLGMGPAIKNMLAVREFKLVHLGLSKNGHPKHPLYIGYDTQPTAWR